MKAKELMYSGIVAVAGVLVGLYVHDKWVAPSVKAEPSIEA